MTQLDDVRFVIGSVCAPIADNVWTGEVLQTFADFVAGSIAPARHRADVEGCLLENGRVSVPGVYQKSFAEFVGLGWHALGLPQNIGGSNAPAIVAMAAGEMLAAGDHSFELLVGLVPGAVMALMATGTKDQIDRFCLPLAEGRALATMCLTEPQAGSDLAAIAARATAGPDGKWTIDGEKIFISGGDQNLTDTIVHLVLARTGLAESGVKGLSLFVCGSQRADGARNAIKTLRIEEKMGLHGAPTCHLRFDGAEAELLGTEGAGLQAMFIMMNHARLSVALQGVGTADSATRIAHQYASDRMQGGRTLSRHADVARMLLEMDALTLSGRALAYHAIDSLDLNPDLAEFLTPVAKSFCTDAASHVCDLGIQVLGGYGYLPEYGVEQLWRDSRVTRIYEGTNGIQAMTLLKRLLTGNDGKWSEAFVIALKAQIAAAKDAKTVAAALDDWTRARDVILQAKDPGFAASTFMEMTALLQISALWLRLEKNAPAALNPTRVCQLANYWRVTRSPRISALGVVVAGLCKQDFSQPGQSNE